MKKSARFLVLSVLATAVFILSACAGALPAGAEVKVSADGQSAQVEFTGVVNSMAADQWVVSGQRINVGPQTEIDDAVAVDSTVKVYGNVTADGTATALKIELPASPSSTPVPLSIPGTFDDSGDEFTGVVESISTESWQIGGQTFAVNAQTELKDSLSVGDMVKVHFVKNSDGSMTATEIELVDTQPQETPESSNSNNEFTGKVEAFSPESWTVKGQVFLVNAQTEIKDPFFLGDVVKVHYTANSDSSLTASEIELAGDNQGHNSEKKLTGILEQISSTQATISGEVVLITPQTILDSGLVVGQKVKAEVVTSPDGIMTATEIETFNNSNSGDHNGSGSGADDNGGSGKGNNNGSSGKNKTPEFGDDNGGNK